MNGQEVSESGTLGGEIGTSQWVPPKYQALVEKALRGELSPRQAIKVKCLDCMGFVATDVHSCTAEPGTEGACPLWHYRPYQR